MNLALFITTSLIGFGHALEVKTAEHPFFREMLGNCVEKGKVVAPGSGKVIPLAVEMKLQPVQDGLWVQEDGTASGPGLRFTFRWMFRVVEREGKQIVFARYIDSNGQANEYLGGFAGPDRLVLKRKTNQGEFTTAVNRIAEGRWTVATSLKLADSENSIVLYQSEKRRTPFFGQ